MKSLYQLLIEAIAEKRYDALKSYIVQTAKLVPDNVRDEFVVYITMDGIVKKIIDSVVEIDPTPTGKYALWVMKNYTRPLLIRYASNTGGFMSKFTEDLYKVEQYLQLFDANKPDLKRRGLDTDIMKYPTVPSLFQAVDVYAKSARKEEADDISEFVTNRYYIDTGQVDVLVDNSSHLIIRLKTYDASKFYGCLTEWCTAFPNHYEQYSNSGFLFVMIDVKAVTSEDRRDYQYRDVHQLYLPFSGGKVECRDIADEWSGEDGRTIYLKYQSEFDSYLSNNELYTYDPKSIDTSKFDRSKGYQLVPGTEGVYNIRFLEWADLAYICGDNLRKFAEDVLGGDGFQYFDYDWLPSLSDVASYYDIDGDMVTELKSKIYKLAEDGGDELSDEFRDEVDSITSLSDFVDLKDTYGDDYSFLDDIETAIQYAGNSAQRIADEDEAVRDILDHIANQLEFNREDVKYDGGYFIAPTTIGFNAESPEMIPLDWFSGDDGDDDDDERFDDLIEPYSGWSGSPSSEIFLEELHNQLADL